MMSWIIFGTLCICAVLGFTFIFMTAYDTFIRKSLPDYDREVRIETLYKTFKVSVILAIILAVLEIYL